MAVYYIDYVAGADTNNGTSTSTPFKHCPWDTGATDTALATVLAAGDFVVFKGGVTYEFVAGPTDNIQATESGSSGSPITLISGHVYATPWGTGRAVIDGTNANVLFTVGEKGVIDLRDESYITVEGLELVNMPVQSDVLGLLAWDGVAGGNIIIDNIYGHYSNATIIYLEGLFATGTPEPSAFQIINSTLENTRGHLIHVRYGFDDVLIENNSMDLAGNNPYSAGTAAGDCIAFTFGGTASQTNMVVRGNDIDDNCAVPNKGHILFQHQNMSGMTIEDNYFHGAPAVASLLFASDVDNFTLRNNVFHVFPTTFEGIVRFQPDTTYFTAPMDTVNIYNNTFVCDPALVSIMYFANGNVADNTLYTNVDIRNNIFDSDSNTKKMIFVETNAGATGPVVELATFSCDYNVYEWGTEVDPFTWNSVDRTFTEWKSDISDDANSTNADLTYANEAGEDFHLVSTDTAAINQGVDLSGTGFSDDKDGVSRPQGSGWCRGAYELIAAVVGGVNKIAAVLKIWKRLHCKGEDNGRRYGNSNSC